MAPLADHQEFDAWYNEQEGACIRRERLNGFRGEYLAAFNIGRKSLAPVVEAAYDVLDCYEILRMAGNDAVNPQGFGMLKESMTRLRAALGRCRECGGSLTDNRCVTHGCNANMVDQ